MIVLSTTVLRALRALVVVDRVTAAGGVAWTEIHPAPPHPSVFLGFAPGFAGAVCLDVVRAEFGRAAIRIVEIDRVTVDGRQHAGAHSTIRGRLSGFTYRAP